MLTPKPILNLQAGVGRMRAANSLVSALNNRMPVILDRRDYARWLDPAAKADALRELLVPFPPERMTMQPV